MKLKMIRNFASDLGVYPFCLAVLVMILGAAICEGAPKKVKEPVNQGEKNAGFEQLFATVFTEWDRNQDGILDLAEINAAVEDPLIHGNESAIAAVLRRHLPPEEANEPRSVTRAQAQALADNPQIQQAITRNAWHIQAINHAVFLPGDPNLETFHQGGMGDCYLLAVIGAMVYHNPQGLQAMIKPGADGKFEIHFGAGKTVEIAPLTDAELIMGAGEGRDHGIWLSVLEKAFAQHQELAKEARTGVEVETNEPVFADLIGHGGYYGPVIALLTGHKTAGAAIGRWLKPDPQAGLEKLHDLLVTLTTQHRLMATGTRGDRKLPRGIAHGHVYAVLDYSPTERMVRMFNPWGNYVKPSGPPGLANGYPTRHGVFDVPLADFPELFAGLEYETGTPVKR